LPGCAKCGGHPGWAGSDDGNGSGHKFIVHGCHWGKQENRRN
jgi:hypothetical protein